MAGILMLSTEQARSYMATHQPDSYTLLDVRQRWEYEEEHLPGATHVPLPELVDRLNLIEKGKPILAYCRFGGRSKAALDLLDGFGFHNLHNVVGGIAEWTGRTAFGPIDLGLIAFSGVDTAEHVLRKAYAMEDAVSDFYQERAELAETSEEMELFRELAGFEDRHKAVIVRLHDRIVGRTMAMNLDNTPESGEAIVEGGVPVTEFIRQFPAAFDDIDGVLELAMMIEAQALDYYLRCARQAESSTVRDVLHTLAREENAHLKVLGRFMEKRMTG
ncbi:sulfurtransferase [Pseudodesulfovibrio sp. JC047]|uniref:rhodanese-like domain-containing protein n=1 Tax=Pseudodesulfovibrio sp. JC047 TaxID=2683199 RepID=UPI0013D78C61|nr:rhodanese-like domain-containing protein [Pseudodesulfovibrio sp. JC047]NDV19321.1 sulfurtransferase [Pseudodesulfovibrio sp. JC047]